MPNLTDTAARTALDAMGPLFAQLHTADPTDTGTVAPSVAFPTRKAANLAAAAGRSRTSSADVAWTGAVSGETVTHASLWSAATGGTCSWRGPLTAPATVAASDGYTIPAGSLTVTLT